MDAVQGESSVSARGEVFHCERKEATLVCYTDAICRNVCAYGVDVFDDLIVGSRVDGYYFDAGVFS